MHFTSQDKNSVSAGRGIRYVDVDKISSVEILVDKSSVEVFVNHGEYVFTTRFYPQKDSLVVEAAGAEIVDGRDWIKKEPPDYWKKTFSRIIITIVTDSHR